VRPKERRSRPVSRILCAARRPPATISLAGRSRARRVAVRPRRAATRELGRAALERSLLALLRTGVAEPRRSPAALVGSYPTVAPLPRTGARRSALCCPFARSPPPGSRQRPALWSPDFPRRTRRLAAAARPAPPITKVPLSGPARRASDRPRGSRAGPPRCSARAGRARNGSSRNGRRAAAPAGGAVGGVASSRDRRRSAG
jgi:hypothetical protein